MNQPSVERPLSPHLQIYRPIYSMVLSITHRATGLVLSACGLLFVAWIAAVAAGPAYYACATRIFSSIPLRIVVAVGLAAFWYHLFAGLRHLAWDAGFGFGKREARWTGALVVLLALAAFVATLVFSPAGRWLTGQT
jgi:succinate dehydrogenase / fumarate reductase, cytochrome b subunit